LSQFKRIKQNSGDEIIIVFFVCGSVEKVASKCEYRRVSIKKAKAIEFVSVNESHMQKLGFKHAQLHSLGSRLFSISFSPFHTRTHTHTFEHEGRECARWVGK
jgi:hypothetical protein